MITHPFDSYMRHYKIVQEQNNNQGVTDPLRRQAFMYCYMKAIDFARLPTEEDIQHWAKCIEPSTKGEYRTCSVSFANGSLALDPELIPRAMKGFLKGYHNEYFDSPVDVYRRFEEIHPFSDGNGRIGHLLWACYHDEWPMTLPPDIFNQGENSDYSPRNRIHSQTRGETFNEPL